MRNLQEQVKKAFCYQNTILYLSKKMAIFFPFLRFLMFIFNIMFTVKKKLTLLRLLRLPQLLLLLTFAELIAISYHQIWTCSPLVQPPHETWPRPTVTEALLHLIWNKKMYIYFIWFSDRNFVYYIIQFEKAGRFCPF